MILEKEKIKRILRDHKISSFQPKDEEELANALYEIWIESETKMEEKLATKEDIKMVLEMMEKRFEAVDRRFEAVDKRFEDMYRYMDKRFDAVDKRFEDMNKKFNMIFTFMSIGFTLLIVITVLFRFFQ